MKHILLEKSFKYKEQMKDREDKLDLICKYNREKGYWVLRDSNEPLMKSNLSLKPMTKKADRETGEDQKGE